MAWPLHCFKGGKGRKRELIGNKMIETALFGENRTSARQDADYAAWKNAGSRFAMRADENARTAGKMPFFDRLKLFDSAPSHGGLAQAYAPGNAHGPKVEKPDLLAQNNINDDTHTFGDVVDTLNPLHHLPVIGTLYRGMTGDTLKPVSSIIGGALFGGPIGAIAGTIGAIMQIQTGKDFAGHALSIGKPDTAMAAERQNPAHQKAAGAYNKTQNGARNFAALAEYHSGRWNS